MKQTNNLFISLIFLTLIFFVGYFLLNTNCKVRNNSVETFSGGSGGVSSPEPTPSVSTSEQRYVCDDRIGCKRDSNGDLTYTECAETCRFQYNPDT